MAVSRTGFAQQRRDHLLQLARAQGSLVVSEVAPTLGVSELTIRRDVNDLAAQGLLTRVHGGAVLPQKPAARSRSRGPGGPVLMLSPGRSHYHAQIAEGARSGAQRLGLDLSVEHSANPVGGAGGAELERLLGVLWTPRWRASSSAGDMLGEKPVVLVERFAPPGSALFGLDAVGADHAHGVHLALEHLRERGHTRILLAARNDSPTARTVRATFRQLQGADLIAEPFLSAAGADPQPGAAAVYLPDEVARHGATAVIVHNDVDALNLIEQLHGAGLQVPGDVSIVAYDDVVAGLGGLDLTTVAPPTREIGQEALRLLVRRIEHGGPARRHLRLLPTLIDRGSTTHRPADRA
ncbi:substrate-binding domain-containing protein [Kineosporia babensis]|uniref:Substrate-binding domain-containing protein n=1 Tax=Kineosporia babensis TaxID=499548 RepID=A0A9X1T2X0_9ACTN|nr:substrate-binding domain-containing protein [Kineosporia babensis]MCD5315133.1 substrate-binding domain-containing protein [Kineosporia babensis]